jgi:hypothetical protein
MFLKDPYQNINETIYLGFALESSRGKQQWVGVGWKMINQE